MIKYILAVASLAALSACSSSSSTPATDTPDGGTPPVVQPPGGGTPPATGTKAGAYIGDFGSGNGVYVIGNDNSLSGLALAGDGTADSLFGNVGTDSTFNGSLRSYFHDSSDTPDQGIFGAGIVGTPAEEAFNLNIVNGQTIESLSGTSVNLVGAADGALTPANSTTLSGSWDGRHRFCGADITACDVLVTEITFNGTTVTGRTVIEKPDGAEVFPNPISGSITDFGDVSLLSFTWLDNTYNGSVFFLSGSDSQLVFLGETTADVDNKTIASLLTR